LLRLIIVSGSVFHQTVKSVHPFMMIVVGLAMFGFAALYSLQVEDGNNSTGNAALQDQTAALQWAHDNVAYFGGDPTRIHMFGESAGGFSVAWHTVSTASAGLYASATMESGTTDATEFFTPLHDGEGGGEGGWMVSGAVCYGTTTPRPLWHYPAVTFTTEYSVGCGCNMTSQPALGSADPLLVCLRALPTEALLRSFGDILNPNWPAPPAAYGSMEAIAQLYEGLGVPKHLSPPQYLPALAPLMAWGPAIDGSPAGLRDMPLALMQKGDFNKVGKSYFVPMNIAPPPTSSCIAYRCPLCWAPTPTRAPSSPPPCYSSCRTSPFRSATGTSRRSSCTAL
jgi:hypothetical protein